MSLRRGVTPGRVARGTCCFDLRVKLSLFSLACLQRIHDSAGKFCLDNWTREAEERRVKEKGHEELPHDEVKEDQDVAARPTARTYSRTDQPDGSREFSERNAGHASARCAGFHLSGRRFC